MSYTHALMPTGIDTACGIPCTILPTLPRRGADRATHRLEQVTCGECKKRLLRFPQLQNLIRACARADGLELAPLDKAPGQKRRRAKRSERDAPSGPLFGLAGLVPEPAPTELEEEPNEDPAPSSERRPMKLTTVGAMGVFVEVEPNGKLPNARALEARIREARQTEERRHQFRMAAMAEREAHR